MSDSGIWQWLIHCCVILEGYTCMKADKRCTETNLVSKLYSTVKTLFDIHVQDWCNNKESKLTEIFNHFTFCQSFYILYVHFLQGLHIKQTVGDQSIDGFWCMMTLRCLLNNINQEDLQANRSKTVKSGQARFIFSLMYHKHPRSLI